MSFPAALGSLFLEARALRRGRRHARQDDDVRADGATCSSTAGRDPSFLVGGVTLNFDGQLPARRRARTSSSRATSTTPRSSTRGPSSSTTGRARRSSPASSSTTPTSTATSRTTRRRSRSSCALMPAGRHARGERRVPERGAHRASAATARVVTYAARGRRAADYARATLASARRARASTCSSSGEALGRGDCCRCAARTTSRTRSASCAAARALGLSLRGDRAGLRDVPGREAPPGGARRRSAASLVIDDFAHHPTAVRETIAAIRARYPGPAALGRLRAALEHQPPQHPPGGLRRGASPAPPCVGLKVPEPHDKVPADEQLDVGTGRRRPPEPRGRGPRRGRRRPARPLRGRRRAPATSCW